MTVLCKLFLCLYTEANDASSMPYTELYNESYSVIELDWADSGLWEEYNRPIYRYISGNPSFDDSNDMLILLYSGSR